MKFVADAVITVESRGYDKKVVKTVTSISGDVYHDEGYRIAQHGDVFGVSQEDYDALTRTGAVVDV